MSFKLLISIILVSLFISAGILSYQLFVTEPDTASVVAENSSGVTGQGKVSTGSSKKTTPEDLEYARLVKVLSSIDSLDASVFSSEVFLSLVSFDFPVPTPVPGRTNPFAPIGTP